MRLLKLMSNLLVLLFVVLSNPCGLPGLETTQDPKVKIERSNTSGEIAYRLTEPAEIRLLLRAPQSESETHDGGMLILEFVYPLILVIFGKMKDDPAPFVLLQISIDGKKIDIGEEKKIVLRNLPDLKKIDQFWGVQNISLVRLDLRDQAELIHSLSFDSLTEWPTAEKLPSGFDPLRLLENAKNPSLGIRSLHAGGIDGSGVGIAIIDQPLLLGHVEYTLRLVRYDATGLIDMPPQMHGSPVASIAVGKKIGVAPGASLSYFAVPVWERDNSPYIESLKKIFNLNQTLPEAEKIRVVSISTGGFKAQPHYEEWKEMLGRAEKSGILVVTCDQDLIRYGTLTLAPGQDPDNPHSYRPGKYIRDTDQIRVPAGGRTLASHRGDAVYTYVREGGMSWAAPFIAGLAALAFQADSKITPSLIIRYLVDTSFKTESGPVINPLGFIDLIRRGTKLR